ncbi:PqqD family protein [Desulfovibrio sp. TomC]|uniref:PqqD family protein n=1 Tax=Desulfovibrio sp. TomC TaxID=1562888 RepID=UPI001E30F7AE|nr:PqqD family protein [Desulfovibrio sp. TomC]
MSRDAAMALAPVASRDVEQSSTSDGLVRLSVPVSVRPALAGLAKRFGAWDGRVLRKTVELDAVGTFVWQHINGRATVGEIAAALAARYGLDANEARLAVAEFLRQLGRRGAVGFAEPGTGKRGARP